MKIRPEFLIPTKSYADHTPEATADILDCSLGENPYGYPPSVRPALESFDPERLAHYPHSHAAIDAILHHWRDQAALGPENIVLTDGSISALYLINNLFSTPGAEVVGYAPTFTDMVVNCRMLGMRYRAVPMEETENYRASSLRLEAAIGPETALVYVDNPNNPTGQTMPIRGLERLAAKAAQVGACLLVDEAYGDFISQEESMLSRWHKHDNVIVVRTFSKGFGLAGLRAGYIIAPPKIVECIGKISNPYMMNELTRVAVAAAMEQPDFPSSHGPDFDRVKHELEARTGENLSLLYTDYRVPICTLRHKDPQANLQQLLYDAGVLTVSGAEFDGLDASAVRLRVPKPEDAEPLLRAVETVGRG